MKAHQKMSKHVERPSDLAKTQDMEGRKGRRCRSWGRISTAILWFWLQCFRLHIEKPFIGEPLYECIYGSLCYSIYTLNYILLLNMFWISHPIKHIETSIFIGNVTIIFHETWREFNLQGHQRETNHCYSTGTMGLITVYITCIQQLYTKHVQSWVLQGSSLWNCEPFRYVPWSKLRHAITIGIPYAIMGNTQVLPICENDSVYPV